MKTTMHLVSVNEQLEELKFIVKMYVSNIPAIGSNVSYLPDPDGDLFTYKVLSVINRYEVSRDGGVNEYVIVYVLSTGTA